MLISELLEKVLGARKEEKPVSRPSSFIRLTEKLRGPTSIEDMLRTEARV